MVASVKPDCPVEAYAKAVVTGEIVAGRLVRLACQRHLNDLAAGQERGLRWDDDACATALQFFALLNLPEGEDSTPFILQPWQQFVIGSLFGWMGSDGFRRFRTAYCEIGKGNGKTPMAAGVGLFGLLMDGERAAEIYSAATTREQAGICFRDARNIVLASPSLRKKLKEGEHNLAHLKSSSFFRPVSSEHRGLDGKRVHIALIDEVHEHPTAMVVDKMRAGTKGRREALIFEITNSGHDRTTVCWHHHEYSEKVLTGVLQDDSWFAYVCTLDPCQACSDAGHVQPVDGCEECDDWQKESVWLKANPNLGVSITLKYLREQVREAQGMVTKQNIVKRLNFCLWTEVADRVIPMDRWDGCKQAVDRKPLEGRVCYGALDIGAISDFTAFVLMFPHDDAEQVEVVDSNENRRVIQRCSYTMLPWFWLPDRPVRRDPRMVTQIDAWTKDGLIRRTGGDSVDYDEVFDDICKLAGQFTLGGIAIDYGFQGAAISQRLMRHFGDQTIRIFRQGIVSMAAPFRELLELLVTGRLHHDGNPVLRWMASNVAAETRGGLTKPDKQRSAEKIDGITAATMALGIALAAPPQVGRYYEDHPVEVG